MKKLFYVVCDNIRSLENIGSIFRTSDAIGVDRIILCGISGHPPSLKISKTALGAELTVPFEYHYFTWRAVDKLRKKGFQIVALENNTRSISYTKLKPKFPTALVVGNEIKGVSRSVLKRADKVIHLPMAGKKESLNVAVAFGVAGYEINKFCQFRF